MFCKSMDWFLYDRNLRHEKIKRKLDSDINSSAVISRVNRFLSIPLGYRNTLKILILPKNYLFYEIII